MSEWSLPQYAILKCIVTNGNRIENPITIEKIPEEIRKFVREEEIAGELYVLLNTGKENFEIKAGDRIAQVVIQPVVTAEVEEVETLTDTTRGDGAWGSTGGASGLEKKV